MSVLGDVSIELWSLNFWFYSVSKQDRSPTPLLHISLILQHSWHTLITIPLSFMGQLQNLSRKRNKQLNTRYGKFFLINFHHFPNNHFITFLTYGVCIYMKHSVSNYSLCTGIECISHILGLEMGYMHLPKIKVASFQKV